MPAEAVLVETAEAVKEALNDSALEITATRSYSDWSEKLQDAGELQVDVVPWLTDPNISGRGEYEYPHTVDILVRKRFAEVDEQEADGRIDNSAIDELVLLTQNIWEFFGPNY